MNNNRHSAFENIDWLTVLLYLLLVVFGWMSIYSAAYDETRPNMFDFSREYGKQAVWIGISLFLAVFTLYVEGDFFNKFAWAIYAFFIFLLILVLIIGKEVNGAKAWFGVGDFGIQPSEFSKIGTGLLLARYISTTRAKFKTWRTRLTAAGILALPAALILLQPDVGSLLTFVAFIFAMYRKGLSGNVLIIGLGAVVFGVLSIVSGASKIDYPFVGESSGVWVLVIIVVILSLIALAVIKYFVVPRNRKMLYWIVGIAATASSVFSLEVNYIVDNLLQDHHKSRIYVMLQLELTPELKKKDADYNSRMAKLTVGSGGLIGQGYLKGPMTQNNYVPEQWTDFIFSAVAEEWGFIGSLSVIILFVALIIRLINLAERQRSQFSRVYGYCVASILFLHLLINVGMVIGLAPIIGIPLPFFSYGGSSLMAFTILLFVMLRLDGERLTIFR